MSNMMAAARQFPAELDLEWMTREIVNETAHKGYSLMVEGRRPELSDPSGVDRRFTHTLSQQEREKAIARYSDIEVPLETVFRSHPYLGFLFG